MPDVPPNQALEAADRAKATLDWQIAPLIRATQVDSAFRVTQNVMRFFKRSCGQNFDMEKEFQAWLADGTPKTLGDAVDAWNDYIKDNTNDQTSDNGS